MYIKIRIEVFLGRIKTKFNDYVTVGGHVNNFGLAYSQRPVLALSMRSIENTVYSDFLDTLVVPYKQPYSHYLGELQQDDSM